jgi:hypothetical protein
MSESDQPDPKEVLQLLQQSTATTQLRDRFEQQAKEYREYLERLNDRTFKYLSILAVAFAIIASIFGFKTLSDFDDRLKSLAQAEVEKTINKEFIVAERDKEIAEYKKGTIVSYYALLGDRWSPEREIPDRDTEIIREVLRDPKSPFFHDALNIARLNPRFSGANRNDTGAALLQILNDQWSDKTSGLSSPDQREIVELLSSIGYEPASSLFRKQIDNNELALTVRIALVNALSRITSEGSHLEVAQLMVKEISPDTLDGFSRAKLAAAFILSPEAAVPTLQKLATSSDSKKLLSFFEIMQTSILPAKLRNPEEESTERLIESFLTNEKLNSIILPPSDIGEPGSFLKLKFAFPQEEFYSVQRLEGDLALEKKFVQASIDAVKHASAGANYLLAEKLLAPLITLGQRRFNHEKEFGILGVYADPLSWQDGLLAKSSTGEEYFILEDLDSELSVMISRREGPSVSQTLSNTKIPWRSIDLSTLRWRSSGIRDVSNPQPPGAGI